jgi:HSP20 family protein
MPGVDRDNINISVENGVLIVEGTINFGKYEGLQPVYSEYNIGTFSAKLSDLEPESIRTTSMPR